MSAIGDYVHFHTINYIKWGINHVGVGGSSAGDAGVLAQAQLNKINASIAMFNKGFTANQRMDLATKLTYLMRPPQDGKLYKAGTSAEEYNAIWNSLMGFFETEFGDAAARVERATANIFSGVTIPDFKKIKPEKTAQNIKAGTIQSRIDQLYNALRNPDGMYTQAELNTLAQTINQIEQIKNSLTAEAQQKLANVGADSNALLALEDTKDLIKAINSAVAASSGVTNLQKGTLFEYMVAVAPLIGKGLVGEALQQAIGDAISGVVGTSGKTSVTFDPKDFDSNVDLGGVLGNNYSFNINSNLYESNHATQDKVDVNLQMNPGEPTIGVSAKNINLMGANSRGVHVVSSASLLAMLANIGDNAFVTHYLNQHCFGSGGLSYYSGMGNIGSIYSSSADILKLSIIQQALQGYKRGVEQADVFIINDNTSGNIRIYNMSDLLQKIMSTGIVSDFVNMEPDLNSISLSNTWNEGSYAARITSILAQIQSYKVTVTLLPGLFF